MDQGEGGLDLSLTLAEEPKKSPWCIVPVGLCGRSLDRQREAGLSQFLEKQCEASWPFLTMGHKPSCNPTLYKRPEPCSIRPIGLTSLQSLRPPSLHQDTQ